MNLKNVRKERRFSKHFLKKSQLAIDFEFIQVYVHVMKVLFE